MGAGVCLKLNGKCWSCLEWMHETLDPTPGDQLGNLWGFFILHNYLSGMVIYYATLLAVPLSTSGYKYWQVL